MTKARWFLTGLIVLLIGSALFAGVITYTSTPRFCSSCHIMETRFVSWKYSDHAMHTSCLSCHAEPGLTGEIKAHLAGSRYVYSFLRGRVSRSILLAEVPNENCYKCHEQAQLQEKPGAGEVHDTYHTIHIAKELQCVECHGGLAHATMLPVKARSAMTLCQRCHKRGTAAFLSCELCHPSGPSAPAYVTPVMLESRTHERAPAYLKPRN
jgi:nitrate/TMAO reductase-like tetraheme cytochrome c subunit